MERKNGRSSKPSKKSQSANARGGDTIQFTEPQKALIMQKRAELLALKGEIADLEDLKAQKIVLKRSKERELNTLVANSLQAHGVDLTAPNAGRYEIDLETMQATRVDSTGG
jgi:hypothetical protein